MRDDPDSSSSSDTRQIAIAVTILSPAWGQSLPAAEPLARRAALAALAVAPAPGALHAAAPGCGPAEREAELSLVLADDATVARLNRDYRGREGPTNVLSFPAADPAAPDAGGPVLLGDVVLAYETVRAEAERQGIGLADHLCHLVAHGVLHLLGYDHRTEAEAAAMERLESAALAGLGVPDPHVLTVRSLV